MKLIKYYHKKYIWLTGFIAWSLFIILVSAVPDSNKVILSSTENFRWDYLEHFLAYFVFGSLYIMWRGNSDFTIRGIELFIMFAVALAFAVLTELMQKPIPGRSFNPIDMIYNLAGVLSSILLVYFYLVRHFLRKKHFIIHN